MKKTKLITIALSTLSALTLFAACASSESGSGSSSKQKVVMATDAATKPFTYTDGDTVTGYDIEVARAVFDNLPDYELEVEVTDFATIIPGIDSGRYQIGANNFGWSSERDEKYYFSAPLSKSNNAIAIKADDDKTYSSLSDLAGMSTLVNSASNYSKILNDYNTANPDNQIEIGYISGQSPFVNRLTDTISGKIDFILYDQISLDQTIKDMGMEDQLKVQSIEATSADEEHDGYDYFLFPKTEEGKKLQEAVNAELQKLEADGTLKELSEKYLGGDFVPDADKLK